MGDGGECVVYMYVCKRVCMYVCVYECVCVRVCVCLWNPLVTFTHHTPTYKATILNTPLAFALVFHNRHQLLRLLLFFVSAMNSLSIYILSCSLPHITVKQNKEREKGGRFQRWQHARVGDRVAQNGGTHQHTGHAVCLARVSRARIWAHTVVRLAPALHAETS